MKRITAIFILLCLVFTLSTSATAAGQLQYNYSTSANSGVRGEICTTLLGTGTADYYTGSFAYENLSSLDADTLLSTLRSLMTDTHTYTSTYNDCHYKAVRTDCENGDGKNISLLYTNYSATEQDWINNNTNGWNREHVWPQSLGGFKTSGPGADLHHIRPSDQTVNSRRGNLKFGTVSGGTTAMASITGNLPGGKYNSTYFEPLDHAKGDVARIILYMYVRYGGDSRYNCSSVTTVFQSIDVLLEWCALDPVDTWEMGRNEVVAAIQGNRNVFIDYPELAWLLFDRQIPVSLVSPTRGDSSGSACSHAHTVIHNAIAASCTAEGYTGDTYCEDCGRLTEAGSIIPITDHQNKDADQECDLCSCPVSCGHGKTVLRNAKDATCSNTGYTGDTYCSHCGEMLKKGSSIPAADHTEALADAVAASCTTDGYTGDIICNICGRILYYGEVIPSIGAHSYGEWVVTKEATATADGTKERSCTLCGEAETSLITATGETTAPSTQTTLPPTDTATPTETVSSNSDNGEPDGDPTPWLLISVIVFAVCLSGLIAFFVVDRRRKPEDAKN